MPCAANGTVRSVEGERSFDPYAGESDERYAAMAGIRAGERVVETPSGYYVATAAGVTSGLRNRGRASPPSP